MKQPGLGTAALNRHLKGLDREMPIVDRADRPADDVPREEIENCRHEQLRPVADQNAANGIVGFSRVPQVAAPALGRLTVEYTTVEELQLPYRVATDEGMAPIQTHGTLSIAQCTSCVILGIPVVICC